MLAILKWSIIIFVVALLVVCILVTVYFVKKENNYFNENKRDAKAIIVGYSDSSSADDVEFMVSIPEYDSEHLFNLKGVYNVKKLNLKGELDTSYPYFHIGDEVYVEYAPKKIMGKNFPDVRLKSECYNYPNRNKKD